VITGRGPRHRQAVPVTPDRQKDRDRRGSRFWFLAGAILLTTDKDFDPLDGHLITRIWFDPQVAAAIGA
jgi:hypothetical protein